MQFSSAYKRAKGFRSIFVVSRIKYLKILLPMQQNARSFIVFLACLCAQIGMAQSSPTPEASLSSPFGTRFVDGHPDRLYVGQLIEKGFYETAIQVCQHRRSLAESGQSSKERAQWRMLSMESAAAKTASEFNKYLDSLSSLDTQLQSIVEIYPAEQNDPRSLWGQFKSTWCQWYVLRSGVSLYVAAPNRTTLRDWCLKRIRIALDELEELESRVEKTPTTAVNSSEKIEANELSSLIAEINLLACDLLSLRGMIYPSKSDERLAAGTQMMTVLEKAEKRIGPTWADRPKLQIAKCRALLLLDRPKDALSAADSIAALPQLRRDWMVTIASIGSEAARALGDLDTAFRWIRDAGGWESNPQLAIEQFAATLATEKVSSADEALRIKKTIAERFGGYWASRTDAILVTSKGSVPKSSGTMPSNTLAIELLLSEVKQLMADRRWEDAIEKLSQGETIAANEKNDALAFQMARRIAAIWGSLSDFENAANEFHRAATTYSQVSEAPGTSMTAVRMVQEGLQRVGTERNQETVDKRESLLLLRKQIWLDVLSIWPESEQSVAAVESLQGFYLSNDQLWETTQLWFARWDRLQQLSKDRLPEDPASEKEKRQTAIQRTITFTSLLCLFSQQSWLDRSMVGVDARKQASEAMSRLQTAIKTAEDGRLITLGERLKFMEVGAGWEWSVVDPSLLQLDSGDVIDQWLQCQLLFTQLVSSTQVPREQLQNLVESVDRLVMLSGREPNANLGKATREQLSRSIALYKLAIVGWNGDLATAKTEIESKEKESLRSVWWPYQSARWMQSIPTLREESLGRYRRIASGLQPGSEGWLESRARTVQTLRMLDRNEEANQLAAVVIATTPNIAPLWITRMEARK
jgi:hypothetical protein